MSLVNIIRFNRVLRELKKTIKPYDDKRRFKSKNGQGIALSLESKKEYFKKYYQINKDKILSNQKQLNSKTKYKTLQVLKELPINLVFD